MLEVKIDLAAVTAELDAMRRRLADPSRLMAGIAKELAYESEQQVRNESGPDGKWPTLAVSTMERRKKKGHWPGPILQISGSLVRTIQGGYSSHEAWVKAGSGPSLKYAAIHQFGGKAGRGHKTTIKPRPFLPFRGFPEDATLSEGATDAILATVRYYVNGKLV